LIKKNYIFHEKLLCELLVRGSGRGGEEGTVEEDDENEELTTEFRAIAPKRRSRGRMENGE